MFEVKKTTFGENSLFRKAGSAWTIVNRKTGEVIGEYQQLGLANMVAGLMNGKEA